MLDMKKIIKENPILAILRNVPKDIVTQYAKAIFDGGVKFFEVALNSEDALEEIKMLRAFLGDDAYIGAGTAINIERAKSAVDAGAQFLLAPSTDSDVLSWCKDENISILPGALTPTDVSTCVRYSFNIIKLFPAGDMPKGYIKSLKGPFDDTEYVAIGGVNSENIGDFLSQGYIGVGLGSNIIPKEIVLNRDWKAATEYVRNLVKKCK